MLCILWIHQVICRHAFVSPDKLFSHTLCVAWSWEETSNPAGRGLIGPFGVDDCFCSEADDWRVPRSDWIDGLSMIGELLFLYDAQNNELKQLLMRTDADHWIRDGWNLYWQLQKTSTCCRSSSKTTTSSVESDTLQSVRQLTCDGQQRTLGWSVWRRIQSFFVCVVISVCLCHCQLTPQLSLRWVALHFLTVRPWRVGEWPIPADLFTPDTQGQLSRSAKKYSAPHDAR